MQKIYKGLIDEQEVYFFQKRDPKWMKEIVTGITFRTNKVDKLVPIHYNNLFYCNEIVKYMIQKTNTFTDFYDFLIDYKNREEKKIVDSNKKIRVHIRIFKRDCFTGAIKHCKVIDSSREGEF